MKTDSQKHYEDLEAKIKLCRLRLRGNQNLKQCDSLKGELEALLKQKRQGLKQKREGLIRSQGSLVSAPKQCEALPQIPEQKPEEPCQAEPQGEFDGEAVHKNQAGGVWIFGRTRSKSITRLRQYRCRR